MSNLIVLKNAIFKTLLLMIISINFVYGNFVNNGTPNSDLGGLENHFNKLSNFIDTKYTSEVGKYVEYYSSTSSVTSEFLGKLPVYFPTFEEKIREQNLPDELKILAIVESHLKFSAYSSAGAAGIWQFISGTAKAYDLKVSKVYDERFMVEESTIAALRHLNDLYATFENWTLALAAYNCGAGNVKKAITRAGGSKDFWTLMKYLPSETRNYVPKFIAISYILEHFNEFGIKPVPLEQDYYDIAQAIVYKHLDFNYISKITGVSVEMIKNLNYAFRKGYIPANPQGYKLILPKYALFELLNHDGYDHIEFDKELNLNYSRYIVNNFPRDVASYMLENGVHHDIVNAIQNHNLRKLNFDNNRTPIKSPMVINEAYSIREEDEGTVYYTLKNGESLYDVSKKFDNVSISDILRWNGYSVNKMPKAGALIKILK